MGLVIARTLSLTLISEELSQVLQLSNDGGKECRGGDKGTGTGASTAVVESDDSDVREEEVGAGRSYFGRWQVAVAH